MSYFWPVTRDLQGYLFNVLKLPYNLGAPVLSEYFVIGLFIFESFAGICEAGLESHLRQS